MAKPGGPQGCRRATGLSWPLEMITWTPALTVNYPDGAAIGAYSATITISVA
ncbi:hypothetical protein GS506_01005 [Rhodococcus hoagii]|nr:hypothetical protein [Prescottella equi]